LLQIKAILEIDEIHDRRHLYVHRAGYVDDQYEHKYPHCGVASNERIIVDEMYLLKAINLLQDSALHVKNAIMARYAIAAPQWQYTSGDQRIYSDMPTLILAEAKAKPSCIQSIMDLDSTLFGDDGKK
jgi:hypothetical protein